MALTDRDIHLQIEYELQLVGYAWTAVFLILLGTASDTCLLSSYLSG
jgi:hypothetical protein